MQVAVAGATGYIGGRLVPRLLQDGHRVRCLVRSPAKLADRKWTKSDALEIVRCDLEDPTGLQASLSGCTAGYYLVHSMMSAAGHYSQQDRNLAYVFAKAARAAGVERIIYLGGLGETGPDLSEHLASRREVEVALASSGLPVTVLRAAMIIGSGSASFEILRYLVERLPIMVTPKWISTPCQPIAVENVIEYLAQCLTVPATVGQTFDIGGPDAPCYREIMRIMAEELGLRPRWIIPIPVLTPRLSSWWIHLVTPLSSDIARPLAEGLKNPVVCRENRITHLIPQKLLDVRSAIRASLSQLAEHRIETNWSMAGRLPGDPDWAGGKVFRDARKVAVEAPAWAVFRAFCMVGGDHGWYSGNWLWKIRGWLDVLVGGPGLRRGRRDPEQVYFGEALDFWRVVGLVQDRSLTLSAEMRLPGDAVLKFDVETTGTGRCILHQTALFKPQGLFGLVYWYSVVPLHNYVFSGMLRGIRKEAMKIALAPQVSPPEFEVKQHA